VPQPHYADNDLRGVGRLRLAFIRMHIQSSKPIAREPISIDCIYIFSVRFLYPFTQKAALGAPPVILRSSEYYIYYEYMNIYMKRITINPHLKQFLILHLTICNCFFGSVPCCIKT